MKTTAQIIFLGIILAFSACDSGTNTESTTAEPSQTKAEVKEVAGKALANWTCVPKTQVGPITPNFTEADLISTFGEKNVIRNENMGENESGETYTTSIVYPNTRNKLIVKWMKGQDFKKIESIRIEGDSCDWRTAEGITIGTTLDELVRINGKDFKFSGFEWDYSGITNQWEGGKINKEMVLFLNPGNPKAVYEKPGLTGENLHSSAEPLAKKADIKVSGILIYF